MLDNINRPSSTTEAAVSSQEVSIPRIRMGGASILVFLRGVFGIFISLRKMSCDHDQLVFTGRTKSMG